MLVFSSTGPYRVEGSEVLAEILKNPCISIKEPRVADDFAVLLGLGDRERDLAGTGGAVRDGSRVDCRRPDAVVAATAL